MNRIFYLAGILARLFAMIVFLGILFREGSAVFADVTNELIFVVILTQIGTYLRESQE